LGPIQCPEISVASYQPTLATFQKSDMSATPWQKPAALQHDSSNFGNI